MRDFHASVTETTPPCDVRDAGRPFQGAPHAPAQAASDAVRPRFPVGAAIGYRRRVEAIGYALEDGVSTISFDDGKANVMSVPFFVSLSEALDRAERDNARAVAFVGRPGMFSGGLDLRLLPTLGPSELGTLSREFARTLLRVFMFPAPTIAALTGHAIAGGAILAYACDKRVAADGPFRIQVNEVAIGIPVPSWMLLIAGTAVPRRYHAEAILHARPYSPAEALERGLVDTLVTNGGDVRAAAIDTARSLTSLAPAAYAESKRRLRAADVARALSLLEDELPG